MKNKISVRVAFGVCLISTVAWAAGGVVTDPTGVAPDRYVYYPGTEPLAEGEIRLIACGHRHALSASWPGGHMLPDRGR